MESYERFKEQLSDVSQLYPDLIIKTKNNKQFLKGIIDIPNSNGKIVKSFLIEIHWIELFPYRFPKLYETGGAIPCEADWHKYKDNSCCITVEPEEILACKDGITVLSFIRKQVIPYLANQCFRMLQGRYKDEYPHGEDGYVMFYANLMKTTDTSKWLQYAKYAFDGMSIKPDRNSPCFCGSGMKYKRCHDKVFDKLRSIGKDTLMKHLAYLIK